MKLRFTLLASDDLQEIFDYIAKESLLAAAKVCEKITDCCMGLTHHPGMGELCQGTRVPVRRITVNRYCIFLSVDTKHKIITIQRILHGAQDLEKLF